MEIFQKSAFSSKDPAKNESKLNEKQPCLTHKMLFVSDGARLPFALTLYIEQQWITIAFGGTTAFFAWHTVYKN